MEYIPIFFYLVDFWLSPGQKTVANDSNSMLLKLSLFLRLFKHNTLKDHLIWKKWVRMPNFGPRQLFYFIIFSTLLLQKKRTQKMFSFKS